MVSQKSGPALAGPAAPATTALRYLYVYRNTMVEFAAYFSTRSVRGMSYTSLTAIEN